jgi:hypothetical protein
MKIINDKLAMKYRIGCGLTIRAQRPGARDATIANHDAMPGSLQRIVRPLVKILAVHEQSLVPSEKCPK